MTQAIIPVKKDIETKHKPQNSRRNFLKTGAIISAGISLQWLSGCSKDDNELDVIWEELAQSLDGELLKPSSYDFKKKASPWALQYSNKFPQGIAVCINDNDISKCILWAKKHKIPFVARSGGHSYGGYSTTTGLIIDVSSMTEIEFNPSTKRITASAGVRNKHVFAAGEANNIAITHGRCFEVGLAGLVLGGGIGFDMRKNGYTCDKLVETKVILQDGTQITCNETENSDLFWACRGAGGGNYGIHTSFTFDTFETGYITTYEIKWTENIKEIFAAIQSIIKTAPNTLGLKVSITATRQFDKNAFSLLLLGQYAGPENELRDIFSSILGFPASISNIKYVPYWTGQEEISEEGLPEYTHERSRFSKGEISENTYERIIDNLEKWPGSSKAATWKFFLLGGEIDKISPTEMAFVHRGYSMLTSAVIEWDKSDSDAVVAQNEKWLDDFHNEMEAYTSSFCYQNFIDPSQKNYLNAYYGENLTKLQEVKRKYDPENLFRYPQSIPL